IDRTELYICEELFLCGTGAQIAPIISVDRRAVGGVTKIGPITERIQGIYTRAVRGNYHRFQDWLTPVYGGGAMKTLQGPGSEIKTTLIAEQSRLERAAETARTEAQVSLRQDVYAEGDKAQSGGGAAGVRLEDRDGFSPRLAGSLSVEQRGVLERLQKLPE